MLAAGLVLYSTSLFGSAEHLSDIYLSDWGKKTIRWDPQADVKTTLMTCEKSLLSPSPQSASHKKITLNLFCRALRHPPSQRRRWLIKVMVERNPSILFPRFPPSFVPRSLPSFLQPASAAKRKSIWFLRRQGNRKHFSGLSDKSRLFSKCHCFFSQVADALSTKLVRSSWWN